jgi:dipeptidyl aminopeptidase/acylaminoacyl peptidase
MNVFRKELSILFILFAVWAGGKGQTVIPQNGTVRPKDAATGQLYQPTRLEIQARYRKSVKLDSAARNGIFKTKVKANWLPGGNAFWYCNILKDSVKEYVYVDIAAGSRKLIPGPLKDSLHSQGFGHRWSRWESFSTDSLSPDKQWVAYLSAGNVFARPVKGGNAVQFTRDGSDQYPYGSLAWSPDSKYIVGYHIHPVEDSVVYYVLSSVAGTTRGQLRSHPYKQPGDPFTTFEMYVFRMQEQTATRVHTPVIDFFDAPELHWRGNDARYFSYEKVDRGHQRFRIIEVDAQTGDARNIVDEQTKTFIYESRLYTHYLPGSNEVLMTSEKSGWRHLYLYDAITGREKAQVTKGEWIVRDIDSVDSKKREIWFSASGMEPGEDPYYKHYYRIGFDGSHLVKLTSEKGNHIVVFSPDRRYYLDTRSEVNSPSVTVLRRTADGKKVMDLETADASLYLASGLRLPEPFCAKGRDGVTDIWGVFLRPADYDPTRRYPVIENIYAGPQDAFVPKDFTDRYGEMQSLAQLGFIVVQIDGMGTANRSKAFHDVCWKNLADAGFPDRMLWIKALARQYAFVDSTRVGLYGTSAGGQNALGGLLFHGDFYKAAVSSCGCQDNRVDKQWWNEQWMGFPVGPHYAEQSNVTNAGKLKGDLLLMVGEADNNVPPESTYRVADALIKAGKVFDFLPLPGMDHTDGGPYGRMKRRDFFVKHLLDVDPPDRNLSGGHL